MMLGYQEEKTTIKVKKKSKTFEVNNKKIVVNPLINFNIIDINEYFSKNNLPRHPLFNDGYSL